MPEQLELDLVSASFAQSDEERLLAEAAELLGRSKEKVKLAKIAAELKRQDLVLAPEPAHELAELQVLLGPAAWRLSRRRRERRLRKNVRAVRKVIVVLRSLFDE